MNQSMAQEITKYSIADRQTNARYANDKQQGVIKRLVLIEIDHLLLSLYSLRLIRVLHIQLV